MGYQHQIIAFFGLFVFGAPPSLADESDTAAIENVFESYRSALVSRDGAAARDFVSASTIDYYGFLREIALNGEPSESSQSTLIDRMSVYRIRVEWDAAELSNLSAADVFVYAVDDGWVGSNLGALDIGGIRVFGDSATSVVVVNGQPRQWGFTFHRENGEWRIDLTSLLNIFNAVMVGQLDQAEMTETEFTDYFLRSVGYAAGFDDAIRVPLDHDVAN